MNLPRLEYPRPQFVRDEWLNLNGEWDYALDPGDSGVERGWGTEGFAPDGKITVPFCPECDRSGLRQRDFIAAIWYRREFTIPVEWAGRRIRLNFGAVDYECRVWVNGTPVGGHEGGSVSFGFDITAALRDGANEVVVLARDDVRSGLQPGGKQSATYQPRGAMYWRITGIWQTVWLEPVAEAYLGAVQVLPDLDGGSFTVLPEVLGPAAGLELGVKLLEDGEVVARWEGGAGTPALNLQLEDVRAWSPDDPFLYDLDFELLRGNETVDRVASYAGSRKVHIEGNRVLLNNKPIFLRLVLDQGFYPEGLWTAPTDADLKADIERSMAVGFNGARLHQKLFKERFHYWADRLGYLTWGEFPDWGMDFGKSRSVANQQREWAAAVRRDRNHPSIIAWTPYNETTHTGGDRHLAEHARAVMDTYELTRALDPTRPVNDCSGYIHVRTDIQSVHDYEQDPQVFAERYRSVDPEKPEAAYTRFPEISTPYAGEPYIVDEYGGTWWEERPEDGAGTDRAGSWGYGERPADKEDVYTRISALTGVLTGHSEMAGFCYTQLTDVEQERNGLYTYDRKAKFDVERLRRIFAGTGGTGSPAG
ncbi:MAG: glycoside hydrolase family 2 TIM barrel-domain containing protein [Chloroflexota bacterium]|nr:glycoside hydrolase family 2 TIM barrel-domain containing protein [Chloroflexota bacterium]